MSRTTKTAAGEVVSGSDVTVDATVRLIHSIENLALSSTSFAATTNDDDDDEEYQRELLSLSSALPLARRIMSSSIGGYHSRTAATEEEIPSQLRKLERSYRTYRLSLIDTGYNSSNTATANRKKVEMDVRKIMTRVESLHRRLMAVEHHRDKLDGTSSEVVRSGALLSLLTKLVGTARDGIILGGSGSGGNNNNNGGGGGGNEILVLNPVPVDAGVGGTKQAFSTTTTTANTKKSNKTNPSPSATTTTSKRNINAFNKDLPPPPKPPIFSSPPSSPRRSSPYYNPSPTSPPSSQVSSPTIATTQKQQQELKEKRTLSALPHEELSLLRECILSLQGMDGDSIKFYNKTATSTFVSSYSAKKERKEEEEEEMKSQSIKEQEGIQMNPTFSNLPSIQTKATNLEILSKYCTSSYLSGGGNTSSTLDAIKICGECGWLYHRIQLYIDCVLHNDNGGVGGARRVGGVGGTRRDVGAVSRAFASALLVELNEYHRLIAVLESQLNASSSSSSPSFVKTEHLTLRRLILHLRTPLSRLRTLAIVTDGIMCSSSSSFSSSDNNNNNHSPYPIVTGGKLVHALHSHSRHGDTRHKLLLQSLTYESSKPWYDALYEWTTQGRLILDNSNNNNSYHHYSYSKRGQEGKETEEKEGDFFVEEDRSILIEHMWHGRYVLKKDRIPYSIMDEGLARDILVVGKGINFVRKCLGDVDWAPDLMTLDGDGGDGKMGMNNGGFDGSGRGSGFFTNGRSNNSRFGYGTTDDNDDENDENYKDAETRKNDQKIALGYHYDPSSLPNNSQAGILLEGGNALLRQTISKASRLVHSHILTSLLSNDHHLLKHLWALKQFLLLGQGDFVTALMGLLHREFDVRLGGKTDGLYLHTMMNVLENAIRSTNARFLPGYVLDRVKVELNYGEDDDDVGRRYAMGPPPSPVGGKDNERRGKGEGGEDDDGNESDDNNDEEEGQYTKKKDGWDMFSIAYDVDAPLTAVVHPSAMEQYKRIFDLLFRLKRIEWMLNRTWRHGTALNHAMHASARRGEFEGFGGGDDASGKDAWRAAAALLRRVSMTTQSMLHFTTNLQSYFMFEVLEGGWKALIRKIKRARTLDELIEAHDAYLEEIVGKSLLEKEEDANTAEEEGADRNDGIPNLAKQLRCILDISLRFCKLQDKLFSGALDSIGMAARKRRRAERRTKAGRWGYVEKDGDTADLYSATFRRLSNKKRKQEIEKVSDEFDVALKDLLATLNRQINEPSSHQNSYASLGNVASPYSQHHDDGNSVRMAQQQQQQYLDNHDSLRFLTFRLDFSEYYAKQS